MSGQGRAINSVWGGGLGALTLLSGSVVDRDTAERSVAQDWFFDSDAVVISVPFITPLPQKLVRHRGRYGS